MNHLHAHYKLDKTNPQASIHLVNPIKQIATSYKINSDITSNNDEAAMTAAAVVVHYVHNCSVIRSLHKKIIRVCMWLFSHIRVVTDHNL